MHNDRWDGLQVVWIQYIPILRMQTSWTLVVAQGQSNQDLYLPNQGLRSIIVSTSSRPGWKYLECIIWIILNFMVFCCFFTKPQNIQAKQTAVIVSVSSRLKQLHFFIVVFCFLDVVGPSCSQRFKLRNFSTACMIHCKSKFPLVTIFSRIPLLGSVEIILMANWRG